VIHVLDHLSPQDSAKLQALYSRSSRSVTEHLAQIEREGSAKFMSRYYVEYGHQSIGDCGTTTLFFEGVSLLVAKAFQDNPLYNGQETSTRYIDFVNQPMVEPTCTTLGSGIQQSWIDFYREAQEDLIAHLHQQHPLQEEQNPDKHAKAVKARAFDILRGFLPAGVTTQFSWHTNLRQAADNLRRLEHHPLWEVQDVASHALATLKDKYPESFGHRLRGELDGWHTACNERYLLEGCGHYSTNPDIYGNHPNLRIPGTYSELLSSRPKGGLLPHWMNEWGQLSFRFLLDFGSYRDLQRQRACVIRMPLLTDRWGFHPWYLTQLPDALQLKADKLLCAQKEALADLDASDVLKQYYLPLGMLVPCHLTAGLPGLVYLLELRSSKTVHPTLRRPVLRMVGLLEGIFPQVTVHADRDPSDWDIRRGAQDILEVKP